MSDWIPMIGFALMSGGCFALMGLGLYQLWRLR